MNDYNTVIAWGDDHEDLLQFRHNKNTLMTIVPNGNVGIGTTTPRASLQVNGPIWSSTKGDNGVFLGTYAAAGQKPNSSPLHIPAEAQGVTVTNTSDGAFFGLISRGANNDDYNTVIAWGDNSDDDLEFRFNNNTMMKIKSWGDVEMKGTLAQNKADVAEIYTSDLPLEPGDMVSLDPEADRVILSTSGDDGAVIGIVSSEPAILLNAREPADAGAGGRTGYPIALCGRVPCKVTDENGPIRRGDKLTASSKPGYAMRAKPISIGGEAIYRPGTLIGKALEAHSAGDGTIEVFVTLQ